MDTPKDFLSLFSSIQEIYNTVSNRSFVTRDYRGKTGGDWDSAPEAAGTLLMRQMGVRELLWVGKKTEERLTAYGIRSIGNLAKLSVGSLTRLVGQKFALKLHENANGRDDSPR